MTPEQEQAHDTLLKLALAHTQQLGGVDPPSAEDAAAGTMRDDLEPPPTQPQVAPQVAAKPAPVDTSKPIGFMGAPPTPKPYAPPDATAPDEGLQSAQGRDKSSRAMGQLGQAVTAFAERPDNFADYAIGLGRGGKSAAPAHNSMWDDQAANGDRAVSDLMARRKSESEMEAKHSAAAKAAAAKDPNSETAKIYRSVLLKFAPDLAGQLEGATPEQMEKLQPWLAKYADENATTLKARAAADEAKRKESLHEKERGEDLDNRKLSHEDAQANAAATRGLTAASLGLRKEEFGQKQDQEVSNDVKDLSKALPADLKDFDSKYNSIKEIIARNKGDVPGVGPIDSHKPDWLQSDDGLEMQKSAGQLLASYQKLITGTGASDSERANLKKISLDLNSERGFEAGLESLKQAYEAKVRQVRSGYKPEVVQRYDQNANREQGSKSAGGKVRVSNGKETLEIDPSDVEAAKADGYKVTQ